MELIKLEYKSIEEIDIQIIDGDRGKNYPKQNEFSNRGFCLFLSASNVTSNGFNFDNDKQFITKEKDEILHNGKLQRNDIVITTRGTVGNVALYSKYIPYDNIRINSGMLIIRVNCSSVDVSFLYFVLKSNFFKKQIYAIQSGSAQPQLPKSHFIKMMIPYPPLSTQQKIAQILSSLDDKIELNNKINANLEQQAQALFKSWFVDFEPFGGKMPEGWKVGKLSEYCNFQEGYVNPAQTHNEYFDGDVKWLRAVDINESFIINTSRTLTKCGFESAGKSAFLFRPGSIAISKSGTVGKLGIISDFMCGNRAVIGIEIKEQQNLSFIHQYLKSRQTEFPDMAVGSVQKNLYVSILENLDIIIPSKDVLEKYARICMPFYDQIKTNCIENNNLCSIRDTLLPKLINGEIEV